ncbi:MAG: PspC domain-containing protein [bacterium]|nr:PspC domain-containing protein [bacterium]
MKYLYRSETHKVMFGVLGGLAEYFVVDPVVLRVLFIVVMFVTGVVPLLLAYLIAALIIPRHPVS